MHQYMGCTYSIEECKKYRLGQRVRINERKMQRWYQNKGIMHRPVPPNSHQIFVRAYLSKHCRGVQRNDAAVRFPKVIMGKRAEYCCVPGELHILQYIQK